MAFEIANHDLLLVKVDTLDSQAEALAELQAVAIHRMAHQLVVNPKATQDCGHVMMANQEAVEKAFRQEGGVDSILLVLSRCESCGYVRDRSGRTPTSLHAPTIRTCLSPSNLFADSPLRVGSIMK